MDRLWWELSSWLADGCLLFSHGLSSLLARGQGDRGGDWRGETFLFLPGH